MRSFPLTHPKLAYRGKGLPKNALGSISLCHSRFFLVLWQNYFWPDAQRRDCLPWCQAGCGILKLRERFICILCSKLSVFCCLKVFSFPPGQKKTWKCTRMVQFRRSGDSCTGRTLCQGEEWLWQASGSASAESALGAPSAARSLLTCQHRTVPWWLHYFPP